ncbi:unnamed protein product [Amoebophrya sp. A120]|nr:unnamed protein product [Amoebophrya sp. A120]|eukprot:GSA120T00005440001.1
MVNTISVAAAESAADAGAPVLTSSQRGPARRSPSTLHFLRNMFDEEEEVIQKPIVINPVCRVLPPPDYSRFEFLALPNQKARLPIFPPKHRELPLSFFRNVFAVLSLRFGDRKTGEIAASLFERAMRRICRIIGDPKRKIDTARYDVDGSGAVGWWEFVSCWKDERFAIRLNNWERIYLCFDDAQSCQLARYLSVFILLTIMVSSAIFVIGTLPSLRRWPSDECERRCDLNLRQTVMTETEKAYCEKKCEPVPAVVFDTLEIICVIIFSLEYGIRIAAAHACRNEAIQLSGLHNLVVNESARSTRGGFYRTWLFFINPMNIIDLMAVAPFYIELVTNKLVNDAGDGEGLSGSTVLRVVRLTRLFRLLKVARYFQTLQVIVLVVQRAAAGLLVLFFVLMLCVIFSASVVFYAEQGDWDARTDSYTRYNWVDGEFEKTPFKSIPHSLWWSFVTYTTVGYGDMMPYSVIGQVLCVISMLCSMLSVGMPTSVLLRCFNEVWDEATEGQSEAQKQSEVEREAVENVYLYAEPWKQCRRVTLEVYDDTLTSKSNDFLGQVSIEFDTIGAPSLKSNSEVLAWARETGEIIANSKADAPEGIIDSRSNSYEMMQRDTTVDYEAYYSRMTLELQDNPIKPRSAHLGKVRGTITFEIRWIPDDDASSVTLEIPQVSEAAMSRVASPSANVSSPAVPKHGKLLTSLDTSASLGSGGAGAPKSPAMGSNTLGSRTVSLLDGPSPRAPKAAYQTATVAMKPGRLYVLIVNVQGLKGTREKVGHDDYSESVLEPPSAAGKLPPSPDGMEQRETSGDSVASPVPSSGSRRFTVDPYVKVVVWNRPPDMDADAESEDDPFGDLEDNTVDVDNAFSVSTKLGEVSTYKRTKTCIDSRNPTFEQELAFKYSWRTAVEDRKIRNKDAGRDDHSEQRMMEMYKKIVSLEKRLAPVLKNMGGTSKGKAK